MQVLAKVQARFDGNTNKHLMILPSCQVQARFDEKIHLHFTLSLPQPTYILLYISLFLHVMILPSWKVSHVKVSWFMMKNTLAFCYKKILFFFHPHSVLLNIFVLWWNRCPCLLEPAGGCATSGVDRGMLQPTNFFAGVRCWFLFPATDVWFCYHRWLHLLLPATTCFC